MGTVRVGEFEWDDAKAKANVRKHGVTFEEAMTSSSTSRQFPSRRLRIRIG